MRLCLVGGADCGRGTAATAHLSVDDLALQRLADGGVIVPDELDRGLVRFRVRALQQQLRHPNWCDCEQPLCKVHGRFVRVMGVKAIVAEVTHALIGNPRQALIGEPERRAPGPRCDVETFLATYLSDVGTVSSGHRCGTSQGVLNGASLRIDEGRVSHASIAFAV